MKSQQRGFSAVEGLLILVILAILIFTGWYVLQAHNNSNNSYNAAANSSQTAATSSIANSAKSSCNLAMTLGQKTGAAGTFHMDLIFTNKGTSDCNLKGYPAVTLVDANGKQIGKAAAHDTSVSAAAVTLKPNAAAYAGLSLPDPGVAPNCLSTKSSQIVSIMPGVYSALKAADTTEQYCPNFMVRPFSSTPTS